MTDWPVKTLGDLMTVQNGYAFDSQYFSPSGKIGLIRIRDLKSGVGTETQFVGSYDDEYVVTAGDYLIGMDGEFRCYEWKGDPALLNQRVCRLRNFGKSLDARFLFHGINKFLKEIEDVTGYTTVKHLSSKSILAIEMPVPPLDEQKRIVALLDAATERVTELTACYEQARTHANDLFTSALCYELESNPDWPVKTLGDVCELSTGGTPSTGNKAYYDGGEIKWLRSGDVHQREIYDCDGRITEEGMQNANTRYLPLNSVLIALAGQGKTRGTVAMLRTKATCNQSVVSIMPVDVKTLLPEFVFWNLHMKYDEIRRMTGDDGNDRRGLNMRLIRSMVIPVAPLEEQKRIVAQLDSMRAKTSEMVAAYDAKLAAAKNLSQSILEAAFGGDL
jgi:type I restriction enzyme S subunit